MNNIIRAEISFTLITAERNNLHFPEENGTPAHVLRMLALPQPPNHPGQSREFDRILRLNEMGHYTEHILNFKVKNQLTETRGRHLREAFRDFMRTPRPYFLPGQNQRRAIQDR